MSEGWPLLEAQATAPPSEPIIGECNDVVTIGRQRTAQQDLRFAIDELVEIASRALSPGVNDPFTAIACIDWLGAAMTEFDRSPAPPDRLTDDEGVVRIHLDPLGFEDYLAAAFGQLRSYVAADPNARTHALATLKHLSEQVREARHAKLIDAERRRLSRLAGDA